MKKNSLFFIALVVLTVTVNAKPVALNTGETLAKNFFSLTTGLTVNSVALAYTESDSDGNPVYYVFNINPDQGSGKGFVIVSAEDATHPVIGYGNENETYIVPVTKGGAANVSFWMKHRKNEIMQVRKSNITADVSVANEWKYYLQNPATSAGQNTHEAHKAESNSSFPSSSYFLVQSIWNQSTNGNETPDPYNYLCPGGSVTGCVATSMVQIMRYWSWPPYGLGSSCDSISNYGNQTICDTYTHHYNWSNMTLQYPPAGDTDIARIMYDAGISVGMEYSPPGSDAMVIDSDAIDSVKWKMLDTACTQRSLVKYFRYNPATIKGLYAFRYSTSQWFNILKTELNANRPINYVGYSSDTVAGHAWVCDGYDADSNFHMNWGWGGFDDGWYALDSMAPPRMGIDFTIIIEALIGIQPDTIIPTAVPEISIANTIHVYPNPANSQLTVQLANSNQPAVNNQIEIYNMLGQEVLRSMLAQPNTVINVSALSNGVYLYRIIASDGSLLKEDKIIVQK